MNPGPVEEAGKVASGFVESMKGNPLALALCVCNILLLCLFGYIANWAGNNRATEFAALMVMNKEVQQLLYNCTPNPNPRQGLRLQSDDAHPIELGTSRTMEPK